MRHLKEQFPGVPVVTYVNTYADVKAETDICCTSGNAVAVVNSVDSDRVIFIPDEFLAKNVAQETGKEIIIPSVEPLPHDEEISLQASLPTRSTQSALPDGLIGWHGRCEVHDKFSVQDIDNVRTQYPDVMIPSHPECSPEVVEASDFTGTTSAMIRYVEETDAPRYLLLTECSMGDNIIGANPDKEMPRLCSVRCPHMGQITMEDTLAALEKMRGLQQFDGEWHTSGTDGKSAR